MVVFVAQRASVLRNDGLGNDVLDGNVLRSNHPGGNGNLSNSVGEVRTGTRVHLQLTERASIVARLEVVGISGRAEKCIRNLGARLGGCDISTRHAEDDHGAGANSGSCQLASHTHVFNADLSLRCGSNDRVFVDDYVSHDDFVTSRVLHDVKTINVVGNHAIVVVNMVEYVEVIVVSRSEAHVLVLG